MLLLWCHEGIRSVFVDTLCAYFLALATRRPRQVTSSFLSSTHLAAAGAADADHGVVWGMCQQKAVALDVGDWFCAWIDMTPTFSVPTQNTMVLSRKISEMHIVLLVSSKVVQWHVVHFLDPLKGFTVPTNVRRHQSASGRILRPCIEP